MPSNPKHVGADREYRIDGYYHDDSGDNRGGRCMAHIGSAATGAQPDKTARQRNESTECEAFGEANRELRAVQGAAQSLEETQRREADCHDADEKTACATPGATAVVVSWSSCSRTRITAATSAQDPQWVKVGSQPLRTADGPIVKDQHEAAPR